MASLLRKKAVHINENQIWESGTIVWALFSNQWWPSMIITMSSQTGNDRRSYVVFWFGDNLISKVFANNIIPFVSNYKVVYDSIVIRKPWLRAVNDTIHELIGRRKVKTNVLHKWAYSNSFNIPQRVDEVPIWIKNVLRDNSESFQNLANITVDEFMACTLPLPNISRRELSPKQHNVLKTCKTKGELYGYCLSCYSPYVDEEHPFFVGHLCIPCLKDLKSVINCQKEFSSLKFCSVCADNVNELITCLNDRCSKSYCKKCIKYLCGESIVENLMKNKRFSCFLCTNEVNKNHFGMLVPRFDFKKKVEDLFENNLYVLIDCPILKKPLTVLSINDSFQIGLKALKELGVPVQMYYVVNTFNDVSNDTEVRDLGYLSNITTKTLKELGSIDLVIVGTPSICDSKMQIGCLHEFFRFLNLLKTFSSEQFFWFFETVASVDINFKIMVDRFLQCKPIKINSPDERLFWGNLLTLFDMKYIDFRTSYGCPTSGVSLGINIGTATNEDRQELNEKQLLMHSRWDLEFFKKLLGFLSDFYHK